MNPNHYLRVEGVNLSSFVFDTRDLSTTRGGGLLLLRAIDKVIELLEKNPGKGSFETLSQGASVGLFAIETQDPQGVAEAVRTVLTEDEFAHATFVVDMVAKTDFRENVEALIAANRWRQIQASSLAVPPASDAKTFSAKPSCALDGVRAASPGLPSPNRGTDTEKIISESANARHKYGRSWKQSFYKELTGINDLPDFANTFEEICGNDKIAVFYADGNNFGKKQVEHCKDEDQQKSFDTHIRAKRNGFLTQFLDSAKKCDKWLMTVKAGTKGVFRFETLLWGGDEVLFVMPAALGWYFAAFFFKQMEGLNLNAANQGNVRLPDVPLTHAASLVFCHHHSPIHRIKQLAKDQMAEFAKQTDRTRDSLVVVALESFDHLGTSYESAMEKRYRGVIDLKKMILSATGSKSLADHLTDLAKHLGELRQSGTFARSQLRTLVSEMLATCSPKKAEELARFIKNEDADGTEIWVPPHHFRNSDKELKQLLHESLLPYFGGDPVLLWLQLEELWDYALPQSP